MIVDSLFFRRYEEFATRQEYHKTLHSFRCRGVLRRREGGHDNHTPDPNMFDQKVLNLFGENFFRISDFN